MERYKITEQEALNLFWEINRKFNMHDKEVWFPVCPRNKFFDYFKKDINYEFPTNEHPTFQLYFVYSRYINDDELEVRYNLENGITYKFIICGDGAKLMIQNANDIFKLANKNRSSLEDIYRK